MCSRYPIACKKLNNAFFTMNKDSGSLVMQFANDFHSWPRHQWKLLANCLILDPKIVIHGNSCIILYIIHVKHKEISHFCSLLSTPADIPQHTWAANPWVFKHHSGITLAVVSLVIPFSDISPYPPPLRMNPCCAQLVVLHLQCASILRVVGV